MRRYQLGVGLQQTVGWSERLGLENGQGREALGGRTKDAIGSLRNSAARQHVRADPTEDGVMGAGRESVSCRAKPIQSPQDHNPKGAQPQTQIL